MSGPNTPTRSKAKKRLTKPHVASAKRVCAKILFLTIPSLVGFALFCEVIFRTIIPATDNPPKHCFDQEWRLLKFEPDQTATYRIGFPNEIKARYRINSDGWNSPIDYSR